MATPSDRPFPLTGKGLTDVSLSRYVWHPGPSRIIYWSLSDGFNGESWINRASAISLVENVFEVISTYINIEFVYVDYFDDPSAAYRAGSDINVAWDGESIRAFDDQNVLAIGFFPDSAYNDIYYSGAPGDVLLNLNSAANTLSYEVGAAGFALLLHEVGHALGLKHTHDDGGTGGPTLSEIGFAQFDVDWFSMMSYADDYPWNQISWNPATPMYLDVLGLQYLYGENESNHSGDSTHNLEATGLYETLWDASGSDLISFGTSNTGWFIIIPEFEHSIGWALPRHENLEDSPTSLWWLMGKYEGVLGSVYDDIIIGSAASDILSGNDGNDIINGGDSRDIALYFFDISDYSVTVSDDRQSVAVTGPDGADTLLNIERLAFGDNYVALDIDGNGGQAYRLYQAAFGRTPDKAGVGYWIRRMDGGLELVEVSARFIDSNEFRKLYGEDPENEEFLTALYRNVLKRGPDNEGYAWWLNQLDNNPARTWDKVLTEFSESPENYAAVLPAIENGFEYIQTNTASPPEFDFLLA